MVSDGWLQGVEGTECCHEKWTGDSQNVCIKTPKCMIRTENIHIMPHNSKKTAQCMTLHGVSWLSYLPLIIHLHPNCWKLIYGKLQREYVLVYIRLQRIAIQMAVFVLCRRLSELMQMNERERGSMYKNLFNPCLSVHLYICPSVNFSHFQLLLQNHWTSINQTWHKKHLLVKRSQVFTK